MKTGEEKFDDEIRQKLRHIEVTPPAGYFDQIVPPSDNRRGFLWMWIAGIIFLGLTAGLINYLHSVEQGGNKKSASQKNNTRNHDEKKIKYFFNKIRG